jgi:amino acid permease
MASAMGTGLFMFPWIAKNTGLAFLLIYIAVGGMFSLFSMYMLMSVAKPNHIKNYNELADFAYGKPLKRVSEFCVIIYAWGITVCFQVVFAKFVVEILDQLFGLDVFEPGSTTKFNSLGNTIRLLTNAGAICVNMIFILKKDLYSLRFITILGTGAVVYNTLVIMVTAFTGFTYQKGAEQHDVLSIVSPDKDYSKLQWANFDNPWLQLVGFASTIFCYVNHQMIFPMSQELAKPSMRRLHKIFDRAHIS